MVKYGKIYLTEELQKGYNYDTIRHFYEKTIEKLQKV